ncbi:hypothetical protein ACTFIZ_008314 [Dictyostelium cf. discoideum]
MSTPLPELKKLLEKLLGDSGKQNNGKEFAAGVGTAINFSLSEDLASNCFKNVSCSFKTWEKPCNSGSSFFSNNKVEINQNETISITNHIVSQEVEIPAFKAPVVNGIDINFSENLITEVPSWYLRSLINVTIQCASIAYNIRLIKNQVKKSLSI